ncbi:MAG: hypothetical protein EAZ62_05560 [Sphingobacteriia bacterium]|nr:MAG: hypothetical protein EAZ62_05560 [Sphingobacteriia bacterium]
MPNRTTDPLFQLVQSLERAEKRNFKLYMNRNSGTGELKVVQLFDALDKMKAYDEALLLRKHKAIRKEQLSNLKAHLYQAILSSLRVLHANQHLDLELHEQLDFARLLYHKGLYLQSLKTLDRLKELAQSRHQVTYLQQALYLEKKIESLHITRSMQDRAAVLAQESDKSMEKLALISRLSNLSLLLYGWYIQHGHARNAADEADLDIYHQEVLQLESQRSEGFYERLYLYQCHCWHAFIRQDFLLYYRYSQKWVDLFQAEPEMIPVESMFYIKGLHNLLGAHFDLRNVKGFTKTLKQMEALEQADWMQNSQNNQIQLFTYLYTAKLNRHFMEGSFSKGLALVPELEERLDHYELFLDRHRILVFYYKIACLYFGSGDNSRSIDYLQKIIQQKFDLRTDLQCYARLLHLIAHYEMGNWQILESLLKSAYRFMARMQNLSGVEEALLGFLKIAFRSSPKTVKPHLETLLLALQKMERNKMETRAFMYLDVLSWLESKIAGKPVQTVIRQKFLVSQK